MREKRMKQALKMTTDSNLSQEIKDNAALFHHYNLARVAMAKKDLATAKTETETFPQGCRSRKEC